MIRLHNNKMIDFKTWINITHKEVFNIDVDIHNKLRKTRSTIKDREETYYNIQYEILHCNDTKTVLYIIYSDIKNELYKNYKSGFILKIDRDHVVEFTNNYKFELIKYLTIIKNIESVCYVEESHKLKYRFDFKNDISITYTWEWKRAGSREKLNTLRIKNIGEKYYANIHKLPEKPPIFELNNVRVINSECAGFKHGDLYDICTIMILLNN